MRNPLLISIFSILLSSVAFAQGDIDLGGKPADDGSYKPSLSHDYFSNQGSQFDRCSALVTGEITKISKIRIVSQKEHTGSAKGNWIETKTSYALEFKPRTVIGGKVKGKLIKVLLIRTT